MSNVKPRDRDKYLNREEFLALLAWAEKHDKRLEAFVFIGGALGLRISEARILRRECFRRLKDNIVEVLSLKLRKHIIKDVGVDDTTAKRLRAYVAAFTSKLQPWMFPNKRGDGAISLRRATEWFKTAVFGAGLNHNYSYHALRHYRGITLYQQTHDLKVVQKHLRHTNISMTEKYIDMSSEDQVDALKDTRPY